MLLRACLAGAAGESGPPPAAYWASAKGEGSAI